MTNMNSPIRFALALALILLTGSASAQALPSAFNGKDFSGWKLPENNIWWSVQDGIMKLDSGPAMKGSTLWTEKEYGNLIMQFEFKLSRGTVDTGIYLRTSREQIQLGISGSLKRDMTGSPYISGKGYPVEAEHVKELLKPRGWNHMTIVAVGNNYSVWLNGRKVMSYDSDSAVKQGPVGIQLHGSRDMSAEYRNIYLAELN